MSTFGSNFGALFALSSGAGGSLTGEQGNIYDDLVLYVDPADRNSFIGTGASVVDLQGNATAGTLSDPTDFSEGAWLFDGVATDDLSFTKGAGLDNVFATGGTIITFIRPFSDGATGAGVAIDTTVNGSSGGYFLRAEAETAGHIRVAFSRDWSGTDGRWSINDIDDPINGQTERPVRLGPWTCVAVTYSDTLDSNNPSFYLDGVFVGNTEDSPPTGGAEDDAGNPLLVGNRTDGARAWDGQIGITLMWTRVLTVNEIRTVCNLFGTRYGTGFHGFDQTTTNLAGQTILIRGGNSAGAGSESEGGDIFLIAGSNTGSADTNAGRILIKSGDGDGTNAGSSEILIESGNAMGTGGAVTLRVGLQDTGSTPGVLTLSGADNDGGDGGAVDIHGGAADGTSVGGSITVTSGASGAGAFGSSGEIFIVTATPLSTDGESGDINIDTGAASGTGFSGGINLNTGDAPGDNGTGSIGLATGDSNASTGSTAGGIFLTTGAALVAGAGQAQPIELTTGNLDLVTNERAGDINLQTGSATTGPTSRAGQFSLNTGDSAATGAGEGSGGVGAIFITGGANTGTDLTGKITIQGGDGTTPGYLDVQTAAGGNVTSWDRVISLQNRGTGDGGGGVNRDHTTNFLVQNVSGQPSPDTDSVTAEPGSLLFNVDTTGAVDPQLWMNNTQGANPNGTDWVRMATLDDLGGGVSAGLPGNIYENLVAYVDPSDRNSYVGTGTTVVDLEGNATAGTLIAGATLTDGNFEFDGSSADELQFTKGATLDNIFSGGGTIIAFVRPSTDGLGNLGRIVDTTDGDLDEGYYLCVTGDASGRTDFRFHLNWTTTGGTDWTTENVVSNVDHTPVSASGVPTLSLGAWASVAVAYDDTVNTNEPTFWVNGDTLTTGAGNGISGTAPGGAAVAQSDAGNPLSIGNTSNSTHTFDGQIGTVLMFDRILNPAEVQAIHNALGARYGMGQRGIDSTLSATSIIIQAGAGVSSAAGFRFGGDVIIRGGENPTTSASRGGDVFIAAGDKTGVASVAGGDMTIRSGEGGIGSNLTIGVGTVHTANGQGNMIVHGGDNDATGGAGPTLIRGGSALSTGGGSDAGGAMVVRTGTSRGSATNAVLALVSRGSSNSTGFETGDIYLSSRPGTIPGISTTLAPSTGTATTQSGDIFIDTEAGGTGALGAGDIRILTGTHTNNGSLGTSSDIIITAGSDLGTTAVHDQGAVSITSGNKAGGGRAGPITITAGDNTGTGGAADSGGITLTTGDVTSGGATADVGSITLTLGSQAGAGSTGSLVFDYATWPAADASGVLTSNGAGVLSWVASAAETWAATLTAGNISGGTDVVISASDVLRGVDPGAGAGTDLSMRGGNASVASGLAGGAATLAGGVGDGVGAGGTTTIQGGDAGAGGNLILRSGTSLVGVSSEVILSAGDSSNAAAGVNADSVLIHGTDHTSSGFPGGVIVRGGNAADSGSNRPGGDLELQGGLGDVTAGGDVFIRSGGQVAPNTSGATGDITISTSRNGTGGTGTDTGFILITTTGAGATSGITGDITVSTGDVADATGNNPGDIALTAGRLSQTGQSFTTGGGIVLTGGASDGDNDSNAGSVSLIAGIQDGSGTTNAAGPSNGGDIALTAGTSSKESTGTTASQGGEVLITAGAGLGTNTIGGDVEVVAGDSTGSEDAGSINLTPGTAAGAGTDGVVLITGKLTVTGMIDPPGVTMSESGSNPGVVAGGDGTIWVRSDSPNNLVFTDDDGTDHDLTGTGAHETLQESYAAGNTISTNSTDGAFDVSGTEAISLDASAASNFTVTGATLTLSTGDGADASASDITVMGGSSTAGTAGGAGISLTAGNGFTTGVGGNILNTAGNGGATGTGGSITQMSGDGGATSGNGGGYTVNAGNAITSGAGGSIGLNAGSGADTGNGGNANMGAGSSGSGATGNGGSSNITSGNAGSTNGDAGNVNFTIGNSTGSGTPGRIFFNSSGTTTFSEENPITTHFNVGAGTGGGSSIDTFVIESDPTSVGITANVGSIAHRNVTGGSSTGELWFKAGSSDTTGWEQVHTGAGATVRAIAQDAAVVIAETDRFIQLDSSDAATKAATMTATVAGHRVVVQMVTYASTGSYTFAISGGTLTLDGSDETAEIYYDGSTWRRLSLLGATIV